MLVLEKSLSFLQLSSNLVSWKVFIGCPGKNINLSPDNLKVSYLTSVVFYARTN